MDGVGGAVLGDQDGRAALLRRQGAQRVQQALIGLGRIDHDGVGGGLGDGLGEAADVGQHAGDAVALLDQQALGRLGARAVPLDHENAGANWRHQTNLHDRGRPVFQSRPPKGSAAKATNPGLSRHSSPSWGKWPL